MSELDDIQTTWRTNVDAIVGRLESQISLLSTENAALAGLRERGDIGDEAFHRLEEELDWAELNAAPAGHFQPLTTDAR